MSLLSLRPEVEALREKLETFVEEECIPAEEEYEEHMKGVARRPEYSCIPQRTVKRLSLLSVLDPSNGVEMNFSDPRSIPRLCNLTM